VPPGALQADVKNMQPFAPFGFEGIFNGAAFVFFSFIGFDVSFYQQRPAIVLDAWLLGLSC
jgi:amino acid transporter